MFNSPFKNTALCMLSAIVVATAVSSSPSFAGEGGDGQRKTSWNVEPDVKGFQEFVEREIRKSDQSPLEIRHEFWAQTDAEEDALRSKSQSSER